MVGVAAAQAPEGKVWYWIVLGITVIVAIVVIAFLRPKGNREQARRVEHLRRQTSDRDIAFLRIGTQAITFPTTVSRNAQALAPLGERWDEESEEEANARAHKLISIGLMEPRGSEVETSGLGRALIEYDDRLRMRRRAGSE